MPAARSSGRGLFIVSRGRDEIDESSSAASAARQSDSRAMR